jgi:hypothetical protein
METADNRSGGDSLGFRAGIDCCAVHSAVGCSVTFQCTSRAGTDVEHHEDVHEPEPGRNGHEEVAARARSSSRV